MPKINPLHCCRVCGFDLGAPPWGKDGNCPSYCICPCCGTEAGIGDDTPEQVAHIRKYWIEIEKCLWSEPKEKPDDWSQEDQLKQIPPGFTDEDLSKSERENIENYISQARKALKGGLSDRARQARTRDPKRLP